MVKDDHVAEGALLLRHLTSDDAAQFSELLQAYRTEMYPAATVDSERDDAAAALLVDPKAEIVGGFLDGKLSTFAVFFDLPEAISGSRAGQLDDLYVASHARGQRLAQRMIEAIADIGRARGWVHLRWLVPDENESARKTYDRFATPAAWKSYALWLGDGGPW